MGEFYVMHGPQGQLQKMEVGGREHVAVWPDMLSALRYKARHPDGRRRNRRPEYTTK